MKGRIGAAAACVALMATVCGNPAMATTLTSEEAMLRDVDVYEYTYRNWNNANTGTWGGMSIGSNVTGVPSTRRRAYIWFDVNAVRARAGSSPQVTLELSYNLSEGDNVLVNVHRVEQLWNEGDGTYHSGQVEPTAAPGVISWTQQPRWDQSTVWASHRFGRSGGAGPHWASLDISNLFREWSSGRFPNYGLVLVVADEGRARCKIDFSSSESSRSDLRPRISIGGGGSGGGGSGGLTITYCDGSTQVVPLDQPAANIASIGLPCGGGGNAGGGTDVGGGGYGGGGAGSHAFPVSVWQPHRSNEGVTHAAGEDLCIQAMRPGGAWFTTRRPYDFSRDYTVEFDFRLHETDNHFIIMYSDGFVLVDIDWGVDLGHIQPGASYNLVNGLAKLEVGRWYAVRVDAHPWQGTFDLYLDGTKLSGAVRLPPPPADYHTGSSQQPDPSLIHFGDTDDVSYRGGAYNRGSACWRRLRVTVH